MTVERRDLPCSVSFMCGHVGYSVAIHCSVVEELNVWSCWLLCGNPLLPVGGVECVVMLVTVWHSIAPWWRS